MRDLRADEAQPGCYFDTRKCMTMSFDPFNFARENSLRIQEIASSGDFAGSQHRLDHLNGSVHDDDNAVRVSVLEMLEPDGHVHRPRKKIASMDKPPKPWYV